MSESPGEARAAKQPPRLTRSVRLLLAEVLDAVRIRMDIAATELEEERARLEQALILGIMALSFFVMGTFVAILFFAALIRDQPYETVAFIGAILFFFSIGGLAFGLVIYTYQSKPRILNTTLTEIQKDIDALVGRFRDEA